MSDPVAPDPLSTPFTEEEMMLFRERWNDLFKMYKDTYANLFDKFGSIPDTPENHEIKNTLIFQLQCIHGICKLKASIDAQAEYTTQCTVQRLLFMRSLACVIKDRFSKTRMVRVSAATMASLHPKFQINIFPQDDGSLEVQFTEPIWNKVGGIIVPDSADEMGV